MTEGIAHLRKKRFEIFHLPNFDEASVFILYNIIYIVSDPFFLARPPAVCFEITLITLSRARAA